MRKKIYVFICMIVFIIPLGGCWDLKYLDELSIVIAMGMDTSEDQKVQMTIQVVNPSEVSMGGSKGGGGGKSAVINYSETGKTIFEAIRKITNKTPRKLYFAHNKLLVIGEDLARLGINNLFDLIDRDAEVRTDFYAVVAKGAKASDILKINMPLEKINGNNIYHAIDNVGDNLGTSYGVRIKDIINDIDSDKKEIAMGSIEIIGDPKNSDSKQNVEKINPLTYLKLNGMAVFKNKKLIDFFDLKESRGIAWILNKVKSTIITVPCKNKGNSTMEIIKSSPQIKAKFKQDQPAVLIRVKQEANLAETLCPEIDMDDKNTFVQLEQETEQQVKQEIMKAIEKAQLLQSDIFGFEEAFYRANPAYQKKHNKDWPDVFSKLTVNIEVETQVIREGDKTKPYFYKAKKE